METSVVALSLAEAVAGFGGAHWIAAWGKHTGKSQAPLAGFTVVPMNSFGCLIVA